MSISAKTFKEIVIAFLLSILAVANASPHIMLSGYQRQLYFILLFLCLAAAFIKVLNGTKIKKEYILCIAIVVLMYIFPLVSGKVIYANRYLLISGLLLYPMLYDATKDSQIPVYLIRMLIVWSVVVALQTLLVCSQFPYASRQVDDNAGYQAMGVGGYMFIYAISLASVMIFSYIVNNIKNRGAKWMSLVWGLYILTIYKANYMTAVIISLFGAILSLLFKRTTLKKRLLEILILIISVFLFLGPILSGVEYLISLLIPESGRIAQIFSTSDGIIQSIFKEFSGDRLPVLQKSIDAISQNPLTGMLLFSREMNFGEHSTFIDTFALWGIPLGCIYFLLVLKPFFYKKRIKKYEYTIPIVISFVFLMVFNNLEATSAFVMCYIALYFVDNKFETMK